MLLFNTKEEYIDYFNHLIKECDCLAGGLSVKHLLI
jgi:hypothetical protein